MVTVHRIGLRAALGEPPFGQLLFGGIADRYSGFALTCFSSKPDGGTINFLAFLGGGADDWIHCFDFVKSDEILHMAWRDVSNDFLIVPTLESWASSTEIPQMREIIGRIIICDDVAYLGVRYRRHGGAFDGYALNMATGEILSRIPDGACIILHNFDLASDDSATPGLRLSFRDGTLVDPQVPEED